VADRILKELSKPYLLDGQEVFATVSVGIAISSPEYSRPEELLRDADTAMYRAKANGKARYEVFDTDMHAKAVEILQMENDLWRAIDHKELIIHYQPILSLRTGAITGFEALLRWLHPEKGLLPPSAFIPLAEETGLIVTMGEWLLKTACLQNRVWQKMGHPDLRLSVNYSARQIQHPDPLKMIQNILWETHMSAKTLGLEITESIAMNNSGSGFSTLFKLGFMGIPIAIDDFGTGYSSLSSLKRCPAQALKVDQSFLKNIQTDPDNAAITGTIIAMAHSLQLQVIAEGVENKGQLDFLLEKGCDEVQGFYFSEPLTSEKATELLMEKSPFQAKLKITQRLEG
jgi:EAL domain-containing protein (putative c-di-GMP-specific phosphodiesterase class I)